jgi:hypothetical protein
LTIVGCVSNCSLTVRRLLLLRRITLVRGSERLLLTFTFPRNIKKVNILVLVKEVHMGIDESSKVIKTILGANRYNIVISISITWFFYVNCDDMSLLYEVI